MIEPKEVSDADMAFGGNMSELIPKDIPETFEHEKYWTEWQAKWFFQGLNTVPKPKPGVDLKKAMRHLGAIQCSFQPKHEVKEAAVAYLASLWFEVE